MALPELQQAQSLLTRASRVLLVVPEHASLDAIASMVALYLTLEVTKADTVDAVSAQHVPSSLQFLPGSSQIHTTPRRQPEVTLDIAGPTEVATMRAESLQGGLRIHITLPPDITVTKDALETTVRALPYDVVVVLGAADLEDLGSLFTDHTDFFYNTPTINIDHRAANEHFGTVNIVDITAGSVAEVTYQLISATRETTIDATVATALYAGIVAGTESFQQPSTTPRSFQVAAHLMELKADREAVIQHLVKTKPLPLLKLAGRLYARLRYDEHGLLFWSIIRPFDFKESGAPVSDLPRAVRELANNVAGFNVIFVLVEASEQRFEAYVLLGKGLQQRREEIKEHLQAESANGLLQVSLAADSLEAAEQQALEKVRTILPSYATNNSIRN